MLQVRAYLLQPTKLSSEKEAEAQCTHAGEDEGQKAGGIGKEKEAERKESIQI